MWYDSDSLSQSSGKESTVRDWSLIMGRGGGATKREGGGHVNFYPYKKGRGRKKF